MPTQLPQLALLCPHFPSAPSSGLKCLLYKPGAYTNWVGGHNEKSRYTVMWEAETENSLEACAVATLKHVVQQTLSCHVTATHMLEQAQAITPYIHVCA